MSQIITDKKGRPISATISIVVAVVTLGYMLPWMIAALRGKSNHWGSVLAQPALGLDDPRMGRRPRDVRSPAPNRRSASLRATMKRLVAALIATMAAAAMALAPAPSFAEEPAPVDCEETVQAWRDRALAAEARASLLDAELYFAKAAQRTAEDRATILLARIAFTERALDDARIDLGRMTARFYRQFNRAERQRLTILRLRERLQNRT